MTMTGIFPQGQPTPAPPLRSGRDGWVLLIDPLASERRELADYLVAQGLDVVEAAAPAQGFVQADRFDVVVVVTGLPDPGVSAFIRRMAENDGPPILVMSETGEYVERVLALELGADDLVERQINPRELLARLRGLMRRRRRREAGGPMPGAESGWTLEAARRALLAPTGRRIDLSRADLALLSAFADGADSQVGDVDMPGGNLRTAVSRLRHRALSHAQVDLPIRNVRGVGYRFDAPLVRR